MGAADVILVPLLRLWPGAAEFQLLVLLWRRHGSRSSFWCIHRSCISLRTPPAYRTTACKTPACADTHAVSITDAIGTVTPVRIRVHLMQFMLAQHNWQWLAEKMQSCSCSAAAEHCAEQSDMFVMAYAGLLECREGAIGGHGRIRKVPDLVYCVQEHDIHSMFKHTKRCFSHYTVAAPSSGHDRHKSRFESRPVVEA